MGAKKRKTSNEKCTNIHKNGPELHKMMANVPACGHSCEAQTKIQENALKKLRASPPKNNFEKSRKAGRVRTSPPSAHPPPQRLHRQHTTCGRLYRKHRSKIAGVPPEKQDFQNQENQAECLLIKYAYAYLGIKFAAALGVRVRLSFAG